MGKQAKPAKPSQQADAEVEQVKPLHEYLPHAKYIAKASKQHLKIKKLAMETIPLDKILIKKAVDALKKYEQTNQSTTDLFQGDGFVYLQIELAVLPDQYSIRPLQIPLPVPIYSEQFNSRFTIFSEDPETMLTDKLSELSVPLIAEVIGYERAKKHLRENKDKLKLLAANDLFFCDWKIYNLLRQPLGKLFYERKKFPYPIDCLQVPEHLAKEFATFEQYLNSLANSTYMMLGNGPSYSLKVARSTMSTADIVKNIVNAAYVAIPHITGKDVPLDSVRSIAIKSSKSVSLPIYNHLTLAEIADYKKLLPK